MEFFVYSRNAIEAVAPHEVPHIVISITSSVDDVARLRPGATCRGVLRLSFLDLQEPSERFGEADLFSREQATEIWRFVNAHRDVARVVVHCDSGVSRSAAVAAALSRVLTGSEGEFVSGKYRPNERVYRLLLEQVSSPDECACPCHTNPKILHAAPCCYRCPSCKTPIRYALIDAHFEHCPESDVCTCACHETGALHARPCCSPCTVCNQNISIERRKSHDRRCAG